MQNPNRLFGIFKNRDDKVALVIEVVGKLSVVVFGLSIVFLGSIEKGSIFALIPIVSFFMIFISFIALGFRSKQKNKW
jgi:hypothetical protein